MPAYKPYNLPGRYLNGIGYYLYWGPQELQVASPIPSTLKIVDAGIRLLGWVQSYPPNQATVQMAVMIDRGGYYIKTSGVRPSTNLPWWVDCEPGNPAVFEGDSSCMEPLVTLDLEQGRTLKTSTRGIGHPRFFDTSRDRIFVEFGGAGFTGYSDPKLLIVPWVSWE